MSGCLKSLFCRITHGTVHADPGNATNGAEAGADTSRMRTPSPYIPDPANSETPLTFPEVDAVIAAGGRGFVKNTTAVMHFVRRARIAMRALTDNNNHLREVIEKQQRVKIAGAATTLDPVTAAKFLSKEQLASLFQGMKADTLKKLTSLQESMDAHDRELVSLSTQIELVLENTRDQLPPDVVTRLEEFHNKARKAHAATAQFQGPLAPDHQPATPATPPPHPHHPGGNETSRHELEDLWEGS